MSSAIAKQTQTEFVYYRLANAGQVNAFSFPKTLQVPFKVNELKVQNFYVGGYPSDLEEFSTIGVFLSSDLLGSTQNIAMSTTSDFEIIRPPAVVGANSSIFKNGTFTYTPSRFILPESSPLEVNKTFNFTVKLANSADVFAGDFSVYVQLEFIQYHPVPFYQKIEQYPTRDDLEKLDRRQQTAAAILGVGITDELHPEPTIRNLAHLAKSNASKRVKRSK